MQLKPADSDFDFVLKGGFEGARLQPRRERCKMSGGFSRRGKIFNSKAQE